MNFLIKTEEDFRMKKKKEFFEYLDREYPADYNLDRKEICLKIIEEIEQFEKHYISLFN